MSIAHIINNYQEQTQKPNDRPRREIIWSEAATFVMRPSSTTVETLAPGADFAPYAGCLLVGVKKSDHRDFPNYRVAIGTLLNSESRFVPGVSPRADLDQLRLGNIEKDDTFDSLCLLLRAAEEWIQADKTWNVDKFVSRKGGEGRDGNEKAAKRTGKTERERAKGKAKPARVG